MKQLLPAWHIFRSLFGSRKRYLFLFLNGFLLASLFYFYMEDNYEGQVFKAIGQYIQKSNLKNNSNPDSLLAESIHVTNLMGRRRQMVFGDQTIQSIKSDLIHPLTFDLMTSKGSCGSYSLILSRILSELDIESRIAQMKVGKEFGGHIVVEAKTDNGWVVLDPSYNFYFTKPGGKMASFSDVSSNWDYYRRQVPAGYDPSYRYQGVRYTNWTKIPVIMPMIKKMLDWTLGKEKADSISIRAFSLRKFNFLFNLTLAIYIILLIITLRKFVFKRQVVRQTQADNHSPTREISLAQTGAQF